MVLHELKHVRVSLIKNGDATRGDFSIDGGKPTENDIVIHKQSILSNPIPGGVEMASLEDVKARLNSFNISITMLALDA